MSAQYIPCLVCRGTGIYFDSAGFGKNPKPCRYCEGTGKTEVQQRTKPRSYIAAGSGYILAEGPVPTRAATPIGGHLWWATEWARALDKPG